MPGANRAKTLGVLGSGQLGRMLAQAAKQLGLHVIVFDPECKKEGFKSPAVQVSDAFVEADFSNQIALQSLANQCSGVTTEFENVSVDGLAFLAECQPVTRVCPSAEVVRIAQDRRLEKAHFNASGVATAPYHIIETETDLLKVLSDFYPAILKTARMGYDGKGQVTVRSSDELKAAWDGLSRATCVLERRLDLASECSVLLARSSDGQMIHWPLQLNVHIDGILATTEVGVQQHSQESVLVQAAQRIANELNYVGVLCIEFFILKDGSWVVNEMAPRPHNSGHITMNASSISQFEAQARIAGGLPLVQPRQHSAGVMLNLLGDIWFAKSNAQACEPDWAKVLALGSKDVGVHLHLYGKAEARRGRKMGHINITASSLEMAWQTAKQIQQQLT